MAYLRPTAISVIPLENYRLLLHFDNGKSGIMDVLPAIKGDFYGELADKEYFKTVFCDGFSVAWKNGQDLCPDDVYYLSVKEDVAEADEVEKIVITEED